MVGAENVEVVVRELKQLADEEEMAVVVSVISSFVSFVDDNVEQLQVAVLEVGRGHARRRYPFVPENAWTVPRNVSTVPGNSHGVPRNHQF